LNTRLIAIIGGIVAIALIVAGCGSGDSTTDSTASLSKAEFVKQGNAICEAGNKEINAGFEEFSKEKEFSKKKQPTQADFEEGAEEIVVPSVSKQIDELSELSAPEGEEEQFEALLENAEAQLEKGEEDASLLADENNELFASVNKEAKALGLTSCAEEEEG
jgi:predicted lipid-binding transport protein (Tim44 family)